jgi:hypothetical protein
VHGSELYLRVVAAADMLHDFMGSVQSAQSKLSALCTCVEDYVEKVLFLDQYVANQKAMDAACNQVGPPGTPDSCHDVHHLLGGCPDAKSVTSRRQTPPSRSSICDILTCVFYISKGIRATRRHVESCALVGAVL